MPIIQWVCTIGLSLACSCGVCAPAQSDVETANSENAENVLETSYLKAIEGFTGEALEAEVESVTLHDASQSQILKLSIPISPDQVDRVQVISPAGKVIKQDKKAEILRDYETGNLGVKLYLPKRKNWVFKLKLIDDAESVGN